MSFLLDTHVFVWAASDPDRLSPVVLDLLEGDSDVVVSAATAWEIATKHRLGTFPGGDALVDGFHDHLRLLLAQRLPISEDHALLAGGLTWEHRDPFDRMLAAQAVHESLTLVTRDRAFSDAGGVDTLW